MSVNNQRLVDVEARLADLESALETQAIVIGRLFDMSAAERDNWLLALSRNMRATVCTSPGTHRLMNALQYGQVCAHPPQLDALVLP